MVLIDKIQSVKANASHSQSIVEGGCQEIRKLDTAKKNVSYAIQTLKELHKLVVGIEQLRELCISKNYKDAASLIEECGHLLGFFFKSRGGQLNDHNEDFSDVEELKSLKEEWDNLCNQLRMQILEEFENIEKGIKHKELLHDACFAIDAMGAYAINDVKMWFSSFILRPY